MQRFLVITDSFKLQYLIDHGELMAAPFEYRLIESPLPTTQIYFDLLSANPDFGPLHEKVFLIIGTSDNEDRPTSSGLLVGISEIEFLVAINRTAAGALRKKYPALHFETLPQGISRSFLVNRLRRTAQAGAGAIYVLLGLEKPPLVLSQKTLMELAPTLPHDVMSGLMIASSRKASCHECPLNVRTFMTLLVAYKRTLPYPNGNAGYVLDMLEIYHYAVNRYDTAPLDPKKIDHIREMYDFLTNLPSDFEDLPLLDLLDKLKTVHTFDRFFAVLNNFSGAKGYVPFYLLKALDGFGLLKANTPASAIKFSYQHLISVANEIEHHEDKCRFALILGAKVGYQRLAYTLYNRETLHILEDFQDSKTDIEKETDDLNSSLTQVASTASYASDNSSESSEEDSTREASAELLTPAHNGIIGPKALAPTISPDTAKLAAINDEERIKAFANIDLEDEDRFAAMLGIKEVPPSGELAPTVSSNDAQDESFTKEADETNQNSGTNTQEPFTAATASSVTNVNPNSSEPKTSEKAPDLTEILSRVRATTAPTISQVAHLSSASSNDEAVTSQDDTAAPSGNVLPGYETIELAPVTVQTSADNNRFGITPFYTEGLINFLDDDEEEDENDLARSGNNTAIMPNTSNNKVVSLFGNPLEMDEQNTLGDALADNSLGNNKNSNNESGFSPIQAGIPPVVPYMFACTDGFSEALSMLTDLSSMPDAEIRSALEAVVLTESPIAEEFVIDRFRLLCRRANLPFKKNVEERRFRTELLNVCEALGCTQDEEGFIYLPNCSVGVRRRSPDGLSRTMRRAMNRADTVSSKEIMAAYQHLFKSSIGISRPEPVDIIELLGLCQRRYAHKEDIDRIRSVLERHLGNN